MVLNNRLFNVLVGKVVGGGLVFNVMVYVRFGIEEFDVWEFLGVKGWKWNDLFFYYKKVRFIDSGWLDVLLILMIE